MHAVEDACIPCRDIHLIELLKGRIKSLKPQLVGRKLLILESLNASQLGSALLILQPDQNPSSTWQAPHCSTCYQSIVETNKLGLPLAMQPYECYIVLPKLVKGFVEADHRRT